MSSLMGMPNRLPTVFVRVSFFGGRLTTDPDMVLVRIGQRVQWNVSSGDRVHWTLYFDHGSPFPVDQAVVTGKDGSASLGAPNALGDYKHGVRVTSEGGQTLADDDPVLEVIP
jgi:hypothetical protein